VFSSAKPSRIDAFMKLLYPFGILESSRSGTDHRSPVPTQPPYLLRFILLVSIVQCWVLRSGMMALPRTPMDTAPADTETEKDAEDIVDVTSLPPG